MKKLFGLLIILTFILGSAGCQTKATPTQEVVQPTNTSEVVQPTNTPKPEPVTLSVWDTFTEGAAFDGMDEIISKFTEKYPYITVKREVMPAGDAQTVAKTSLSSGTGPDILYYDTGPGSAGVLAQAGLLLPLDDYYKKYKWDDRIFTWTKERTTFGGKVYGIANELEFFGAYYNTNLFTELGFKVPETYEDLLTLCQKGKDAGYIPIAFADGSGWPAFHMFSLVVNNLIGPEGINNILYGEGRWDTPEITKAIKLFFVDMYQAGCFIPDITAVMYPDANALFFNGKALMDLTGTWVIGSIKENVSDFETGWFFFPSIEGKKVYPPAGIGSGYFISAATTHPEEAALYLDFLFSQDNAKIWLETIGAVPPMTVDVSNMELTPLMKFAVEALQTQEMGLSIDVLVPLRFQDEMLNGFQKVLLGEITPEQQAAALQKVWEEAKAAGEVLKK